MVASLLPQLEDELHEAAVCKTGFDDFGDRTYRHALRTLLEAFDTDLRLTEVGWRNLRNRIVSILIARLYTQKGWAEHPEVFTVPIEQPLVIVGLPRTGTTALHRLLSVDPQFQGLEAWLARAPMIRPQRETWETHPAYRDYVADLEALYIRKPNLRKVHDTAADEVEECVGVLLQSFVGSVWLMFHNLPTYAHWFSTQSAHESYRRYVDVLRLIGAREPNKRWLLKCPHHIAEIDALLDVFPDACIIQTHRDPLKTIPSLCSLVYTSGWVLEGEASRPGDLGPRQCAHWRKALDRMRTVRQKHPKQLLDIDHRHFVADPMRTVLSIYDYFGLTLSPETEQRMRAWIVASPTSKHGKHEYSVHAWGITPEHIREAFAEYRAQYRFD